MAFADDVKGWVEAEYKLRCMMKGGLDGTADWDKLTDAERRIRIIYDTESIVKRSTELTYLQFDYKENTYPFKRGVKITPSKADSKTKLQDKPFVEIATGNAVMGVVTNIEHHELSCTVVPVTDTFHVWLVCKEGLKMNDPVYFNADGAIEKQNTNNNIVNGYALTDAMQVPLGASAPQATKLHIALIVLNGMRSKA